MSLLVQKHEDAATAAPRCALGYPSLMNDLTGKVARVTGSSRGIGRAIALAPARAGTDVAVNYLRRSTEAPAVLADTPRHVVAWANCA